MADWAEEKAREAINATGLGLSGIVEIVADALRQARIHGMEEAAQICEVELVGAFDIYSKGYNDGCLESAKAIRFVAGQIKDKQP